MWHISSAIEKFTIKNCYQPPPQIYKKKKQKKQQKKIINSVNTANMIAKTPK